jgi:2-oxoglutarate dehydrogenase complex dehydrogenase (E1) component-like enzyme
MACQFGRLSQACEVFQYQIKPNRWSRKYKPISALQVYYELDEERKKSERSDVAICRVEQLCPFPYDLIQRELKRYPSM